MAEEPAEDFSKLSIEDKVVHKSWKARQMGYEELIKLFKKIDDEKSRQFDPYVGMFKKFVVDSNVMAQEKALEATLSFVEFAAAAPKTCGEVVPGLVAKGFNGKPKTKQLAFDLCLMYIEIEKQDIVQEELFAGLKHKQPKIVAACLDLLTSALRLFGAKVMDVKRLMKVIPPQFDHRDKTVREGAKGLVVELYRWLGPALKPNLETNLKPVQMKEIEEEWSKLPSKAAAPERYLRSQQKKQQSSAAAVSGAGDEEGSEGEEEMDDTAGGGPEGVDPYDLFDPVDMLGQMPKDFFDNIADAKWKIRKEALEAILPLATKPKLAAGDYGELVRTLRKVITKDSNVMVVALAGNIVKGLAIGLRKNFQPYSANIIGGILEKFKEKKVSVVTALKEAADAVYLCTTLGGIEEEAKAGLGDKNPSVKSETSLFLSRCFQQCSPDMMPKGLLKAFCPLLVQCLSDNTPAVREAAAEALGTALKVVGERMMGAYLDGVESLKMAKINEFKDKVELRPLKGAKKSKKTGKPKAEPVVKEEVEEEPPPVPKPKKKKAASKKVKEEASAEPPKDPKPVAKPPSKKATAGKKQAAAKPSSGKGKGKGGGATGVGEAPDPAEENITTEDAEERAATLLPGNVCQMLSSAKWKDRLEAHEGIQKIIEGMSPDEVNSLLLVKILGLKPGWKDNNFQVVKIKVTLVGIIAAKATVFGRKSTSTALPTIVDKLADAKIKAQSSETLMLIAERMTLNYVSLNVLKHAFGQKNPKVQHESLEWLSQALKEFGFLINIKPHVEFVNKAFESTNPTVRSSAVSLLGVMGLYVGAQLRMFFEDAKPALLQQIDAVFEKSSDDTPPTPTRGPNVKSSEGEEEESEDEDSGPSAKAGPPQSMADLMPKVDISPQIKSELINELGDKNWKVRGEALQKVTDMLSAAKFIQPSLGDLPGALKARLNDSNKNLVTITLNILSSMATAMGSSCSKHSRTLLPAILTVLADAKPQVRLAAANTLNVWHDQLGLVPFVEGESLSTALATENPNLRTELLQWLNEKLPNAGKMPAEFSAIITPLFSCLEDRSAEVRKRAQEILPLIMAQVGYDAMMKQTGKMKQASKQQIGGLLDKHRAAMPSAKPSKAKQPPPPQEEEEIEKPVKSSPSKKTKSAASKVGGSKKGTSSKSKGNDEESGPPLVMGPTVQQREKDEKNYKVLKWSFSTPRPEFTDQLRDQLQQCVSKSLLVQLFHDDFKQHLTALQVLKDCISDDAPYQSEALNCADLLLKWVTLRFFNTNTTVNLKCLEFLSILFGVMSRGKHRMTDFEASSFIPFLVTKSGDAKDAVRKEVRGLFDQLSCIYPPPKMYAFVADGSKSKNARQRTECLEILGVLIQNNGVVVCQPSVQKAVHQIGSFISEKDSTVRNAALNTLVILYDNIGDAVYKHVGNLPAKDMSMLEERIRRAAKRSTPESSGDKTVTILEDTATEEDQSVKTAPKELPRIRAIDPDAVRPVDPSSDQPPVQGNSEPQEFQQEGEANTFIKRSVIPVPDGPLEIDWSKYNYPNISHLKMPRLKDIRLDFGEDPEIVDYATSQLLSNPPPSLTFSPKRMKTTSAAITYIISQITNTEMSASLSALKQIDDLLGKAEYHDTLTLKVDQLLCALLMQLRMTFTNQLQQGLSPETRKQVFTLCKRMSKCLVQTFNVPKLASSVSRDTLIEVERDIIGMLCDERLEQLEEIDQFNRTLNVLMLKVMENGERNAVYGSLLHFTLESLNEDGNPTKLTEVVVKCLWKLTRNLNSTLHELNIAQLLLDIHNFWICYARITEGKKIEDNTPIRTVKTILFHLATLVGSKVFDHMTLIENAKQSLVYKYAAKSISRKRLSVEGKVPSTAVARNVEVTEVKETQKPAELHIVPIPPEMGTRLGDILQTMNRKDNLHERQGFRDLYRLLEEFPSFDFEAVMVNQTAWFKKYMKKGLKVVEYERECHSRKKKPLEEEIQNIMECDELKERRKNLEDLKTTWRNMGCDLNDRDGVNPGEIESAKPVRSAPSNRKELSALKKESRLPPRVRSEKTSKLQAPSSVSAKESTLDLTSLRQRISKLKKGVP